LSPTFAPSPAPTVPTATPTLSPTVAPTVAPTLSPTPAPTAQVTVDLSYCCSDGDSTIQQIVVSPVPAYVEFLEEPSHGDGVLTVHSFNPGGTPGPTYYGVVITYTPTDTFFDGTDSFIVSVFQESDDELLINAFTTMSYDCNCAG
jgi:hypothetical protein